ncbi:MAG: response regulator transcription factor, partial [Clostridium sp.]|nr:response regulator transcription factor [Clostridium sp.]
DKVKGFDMGADEYMTKPFEMEELLARLRALFRKREAEKPEDKVLKFKELSLNRESYEVYRGKDKKELTKKEFDLLTYLLENQGIVLTREKILNQVWGFDFEGETNVVDVYIRFLRSKLDDGYEDKLIHTVRGAGYLIR